jgi:membrane-associated phospholipid phosphatase
MLKHHRRAFWYALLLLGSLVFVLVGVGKHPPGAAPLSTIPFFGQTDARVYDWIQTHHVAPLTSLSKVLSFIGGGIVTTPVRIIASLVLAIRRAWRRFGAFVLTWAASEILMTVLKNYFHRGRPPHPLVATNGYSFPSGHATAGAALAIALVLAFFPPGDRRRKWEWIAVGFAFVMASSRIYLNAHWFFDVVAGVLLGAGIALGSAALATEIAHLYRDRHPPDAVADPAG